MALFMIVCAVHGERVSTGIRIEGPAWNKNAEFLAYSHCPLCGLDHEWSARDVTLGDEPAAGLTAIALHSAADAAGCNAL